MSRTLLLALACLAFLAGCASNQTDAPNAEAAAEGGNVSDGTAATVPALAESEPEPWAMPDDPAAGVTIYDGATGRQVPADSLLAAMAAADVVTWGELHGHPRALPFAAHMFRRLAETRPNSAAIAKEFIEADNQVYLDDYTTGMMERDALLDEIDPNRSLPPEHLDMLDACREMGLRAYAANAPRRYVRKARIDGLDSLDDLTPAQRRLVADEPDVLSGEYKARFTELLTGAHTELSAEQQAQVDAFYVAMNVWDATMAQTVGDALEQGARPVWMNVGMGHTLYGLGLAERIAALESRPRLVTVAVSTAEPDAFDESQRGIADYVIQAGPMQ